MKICFLVGTLARGGAEKQLVMMLRALRQTGIETKVLCLTQGESYQTEIEDLGVEIEWVGTAQNQVLRLWKIIKSLREARADIVQSSHFYTNLYAAIAGKILRIRSIGAVRSDLQYELASHRLTGKLQIALPDFLIVNSRGGYERLIECGIAPAKIEFVRNVVEIKEFGNEEKKIGSHPLNILFVGRLDANKRPEMFLRLAARIVAAKPDDALQFCIAGDGILRGELEKSAFALGLSPNTLQISGTCDEMSEVYRRADILVSTSKREGTPNVVLEAMAHGLPVAATNAGGTAEILDASRGFLVGQNDEEELFESLLILIENSALCRKLGRNGRRYVGENHSLDYLQNHLMEIYSRLIGAAEIKIPSRLSAEKTL